MNEPTNATGYPRGREREPVPIIVLRQAFHESGLSVRELARRLKVHHSSVGRKVSGWKAHQYTQNAAGEVVDYDARFISVRRLTAIRYIRAMGLDPADYGLSPSASGPDTSTEPPGEAPLTQAVREAE